MVVTPYCTNGGDPLSHTFTHITIMLSQYLFALIKRRACVPPIFLQACMHPCLFCVKHINSLYLSLRHLCHQNPPVVPTSAPWVQTNSGPPPVGPSYVDPHGSEIMYSQPELPFSDSSQDCFIPQGQVGSH